MDARERIRSALARRPAARLSFDGFRRAAVLVPLIERSGQMSLVFIVRSEELTNHAGQISFPGGQPASADERVQDTALREAHEELSIAPSSVALLGSLDDVATPTTRFIITPLVGWLQNPPPFIPDPGEVDTYFEVSLEELADPARFHLAGEVVMAGRTYPLPEYHVTGGRIWGATARIIQLLLDGVRSSIFGRPD